MPLDSSDFPVEVQVAFFIFSLMSDVWEGTSGSYMGKDWSAIESLLNINNIEDKKTTIYFLKMYENAVVSTRAKEAERKRKAEERKSKSSGGGKNFTHNVTG